jgi:hypothetical protein
MQEAHFFASMVPNTCQKAIALSILNCDTESIEGANDAEDWERRSCGLD